MTKRAFLFPGQGAQAVGMGQSTANEFPTARRLFDEANDLLGYDLATLCFEGPSDQLDSTVHSQPALFVCSLAALERLKAEQPAAVEAAGAAAGLSLGEYTALVFAGAMDFADALRIVQCRGRAMQAAADATSSGMVSVLGLEAAKLGELCEHAVQEGEILQIANYLCPGNLVCSGHRASCDQLTEEAKAAGAIKVIPLAVAGAFHTPLMESAVEPLQQALSEVRIVSPHIPVLSNVDAQPRWDAQEIRDALVRQVVSPVRWEESMRRLIDDGFDTFYEVGPGKVLRGLLRRINRKLTCENCE